MGEGEVLITGARLVTGRESEPIDQGAVLVQGGRVAAVGSPTEIGPVAAGVPRLDFPNGTIVPGLIDTHTHLTCSASDQMVRDAFEDDDFTVMVRATEHVRGALRAGITTLRDCGSRHHVVTRLRAAIEQRIIPGPRLLLCGSLLTTTGGHLYFVGHEVDDIANLRHAVRAQVKAGADFIKVTGTGGGLVPGNSNVYRQFDDEALSIIVDEAERLGVHVGVHCLSREGVSDVLAARPRTVEHLSFYNDERGTIVYDPALIDDLVQKDIWASQVIVGWHRRVCGPNGALRADLDAATMKRLEDRVALLEDMHRRGLKILAGSDAGMPHTTFDNFGLILDLSVRHIGMSTMEAIRSATVCAAEALELSDRGVLAPGYLADIAVLEGNPFADTTAFYRSQMTMIGGEIRWRAGT